jgi:hypothetical protein
MVPFFIAGEPVSIEIVQFCDSFTNDIDREDLKYIDCVWMNQGKYGNDPAQLKKLRQELIPIFD